MKKPSPKKAPAAKSKAAKPKSAPKGKGKGKGLLRKVLLRTGLILLGLLILLPVVHYFVFPQQTRSILIGYSDFKQEDKLYYDAAVPEARIDSLKQLISLANARVEKFWQEQKSSPKIIYCDTDADFAKYGSPNPVPAVTIMKLGAHVVLSRDGLDLDIIAHEICHAELYARIGFYAQEFKVPTWFSEGLAMQCDLRPQYSEDTLRLLSNNFQQMPHMQDLKSPGEFFAGSEAEIQLHYMAARHTVAKWYTHEKLMQLIADLNDGQNFTKAFAGAGGDQAED